MVRSKTFQEILAEKMAESSVTESGHPSTEPLGGEAPSLLESLSLREIAPPLPSAWSRSAKSAYGVGRRLRGTLWCLPSPRVTPIRRPSASPAQEPPVVCLAEAELSPAAIFALEVFRRLGQELEVPLTEARVKRAYRRLAQQHHPDRSLSPEAGADAFLRLQEAYQTLLAEFTQASHRPAEPASTRAA